MTKTKESAIIMTNQLVRGPHIGWITHFDWAREHGYTFLTDYVSGTREIRSKGITVLADDTMLQEFRGYLDRKRAILERMMT